MMYVVTDIHSHANCVGMSAKGKKMCRYVEQFKIGMLIKDRRSLNTIFRDAIAKVAELNKRYPDDKELAISFFKETDIEEGLGGCFYVNVEHDKCRQVCSFAYLQIRGVYKRKGEGKDHG
ncbi:hypothetical protein [Bacteroides sp. 41_26]|uniref:hypothetical protein n=1 Tax=Bacteroides sp. 41_26 TaxID=1896973 RepID=UPI00259CDC2B|nr:hypothetical protein [Bacteroides sp. 41_26]